MTLIAQAARKTVGMACLTAGTTLSSTADFPRLITRSAEKYDISGLSVFRPEAAIVPKEKHDQDTALVIRRAWLQMMGLTDEEIENDIRENPLDLPDEIANLSAMSRVQKLNESSAGRK